MRVGKDKVVSVDYTLTDSTGNVLDTSKGQEPLLYLHGVGSIVPGLETALEGKSAGEEIAVTVPPEQAYGQRDENLVQDVPRTAFGESKVEPGMQFRAEGKNAGARLVSVVSVGEQTVRIDANHPLAGKTLHFDVKVVSVRDATREEVTHGHVHGPGGHHHH
jgi:FKBP-type peptidyl-prolyl cis-trans isomerase SlyD